MEFETHDPDITAKSSSSGVTTRKSRTHAIFGSSAELPTTVLPTINDIARYFVHLKKRPKSENFSVIRKIADDVIGVWCKASVPVLHQRTVEYRVKKLIDKGSQLKRSKTSKKMLKNFTDKFSMLFDICSCSCKLLRDEDTGNVTVSCCCPRDKKVPQRELQFLHDQRSKRKMCIGEVDIEATRKMNNVCKRKVALEKREAAEKIESKKMKTKNPAKTYLESPTEEYW